jgi:hypothetical protein
MILETNPLTILKSIQGTSRKWIDTIDIKNTLEFGDVDFDNSNTEFRKAKLFVIEGKTTKTRQSY